MPGHMLEQAARFAHALREAGVPVPLAGVVDFCRSLEHVDLARREDLFAAGCATLISSSAQLAVYERVFGDFWRANPVRRRPPRCGGEHGTPRDDKPRPQGAGPAASAAAVRQSREDDVNSGANADKHGLDQALAHKSFAAMSAAELAQARLLLAGLAALLVLRPGRRHVRTQRRAMLDLRAMLRQNVRLGSDGIQPLYRTRRRRRTRVFVLCDVSGSMERHTGFLIQFMHALRARLPALELAVFSTGMTVITHLLDQRDLDRSLGALAAGVPSWSGGTDIGTSLAHFNERFGDAMIASRSFVIVLSDGWDCGDAGRMEAELGRLRHRAHRVLWLNPQLADARYEPLCRGMALARRHIDHLLPAHSIAALAALVPHLRAAWR